jgi:transposase
MTKRVLDDRLWALIQPHCSAQKPRRFPFPGRKPIGNRQTLTGILFVLVTGIPRKMLPRDSSLSMAKVSLDSAHDEVARRHADREPDSWIR